MLSRLIEHRKQIGMAILLISFAWLICLTGTDDANVMQHVYAPILSLIGKGAIGLAGMGLGAMLIGGDGCGED